MTIIRFPLAVLLIIASVSSFSQKQSFDVVSFTIPKGWQQQQNEGGVQLSVADTKSGAYAMAVITRSDPSSASAIENFNTDWAKLVKSTVQVNAEPAMQETVKKNNWDIISGSANYTDGATTGMATLLTATSSRQSVSVVLMTNTKQYQNELLAFINSLELVKLTQNETGNAAPAKTNETGNPSIIGLWCDNHLETSGYANGFPQYTAGYFRREYLFKEDGTYIFRLKDWSTLLKEILFAYESGTYTVQGNQLIIIPDQGRGEWWTKRDNNTKLWGNRSKASDYKAEKMNYTFEIKYYSGTNNYGLFLNPKKNTERDGTYNDPNGFSYTKRETGESLIDNPPGFKTGFENKSSSVSSQTNNAAANTVNSPLAGKIWEGSSSEKYTGNGTMTGYNTGGFSTVQYKFNADGTYRFASVRASHYTDTKTLVYETGTWSVNGNELTINPTKGENEEWSKTGKTSNANSDVTNRAINETWGKKLKTSSRKLEHYTYTFSIGKNGNNIALILQRSGHTDREGAGTISYYNETAPERSLQLPGTKK